MEEYTFVIVEKFEFENTGVAIDNILDTFRQ